MMIKRLLLVSTILLGVAVASAGHAGADEGPGVITVESADPSPDGSVRYVTRLTWANDGHPVADATITATPVGSDGVALTPVTLTAVDQDGRYGATVTLPEPGQWTVRFTSVTPPGTLEVTQQVEPPPTTSTVPRDTTTTESIPTTTTVRAEDREESDDGAEGSSSAVAVFWIVLGAIVGVSTFIAFRARQHRRRVAEAQTTDSNGPRDLDL